MMSCFQETSRGDFAVQFLAYDLICSCHKASDTEESGNTIGD